VLLEGDSDQTMHSVAGRSNTDSMQHKRWDHMLQLKLLLQMREQEDHQEEDEGQEPLVQLRSC